MKITVNQSGLAAALNFARSVSSVKSPNPLLNTVLFSKESASNLRVTATDLDLGFTAIVDAKVDGDVCFALPGAEALARVKAFPAGDISMAMKDNAVTFSAKGTRRKFELSSFPGSEFPELKRSHGEPILTVPCALIASMIEAVKFAISDDLSRPHLASMLFRWSPGSLVFAATDGHRLATEKRNVDGIESSGEMLISSRAVAELKKILDDQDSVTVSTVGASSFFSFAGIDLSTRLPDAKFPPFEQVIPEKSAHLVRVRVKDLTDAIGAVSLSAGRTDNKCGVKLTFSGSEIALAAESADKGTAADFVVCEYGGPKLTIGVDANYLRQSLDGAACEVVALSVGGELDPVRIEPWEQSAGRVHVGIVMPIRV